MPRYANWQSGQSEGLVDGGSNPLLGTDMSKMQELKEAHPDLFDSNNWDHQSGFGMVDLKTKEVGYLFRFDNEAEKRRFELYLFNKGLKKFDGHRLVADLKFKVSAR